jgi:hypothetical protein
VRFPVRWASTWSGLLGHGTVRFLVERGGVRIGLAVLGLLRRGLRSGKASWVHGVVCEGVARLEVGRYQVG